MLNQHEGPEFMMNGFRSNLLLALLVMGAPALAGNPIPESERWATITHPGNAPYVYNDFFGREIRVGGVDHEYQISRTETTATEWLEFVRAQAPHLDGFEAISPEFMSQYINFSPVTGDYFVFPGYENVAVEGSWRYGARFCNWLSNDKAINREAFESGAYNVSTFGFNPDGSFTDQIAHSPGAKYWIPTQDELVKASHWDPNRGGPGTPGYWFYPHSSDTAPVQGAPGVGETNGGTGDQYDVASYKDVQSPLGLWDTTGGVTEWTESLPYYEDPLNPGPHSRLAEGSAWDEPGIRFDQIDSTPAFFPTSYFRAGFRVVRIVPCSSSALVCFGAVIPFTRRRRPAYDTPFLDY
jgi:formylglycine-generating enzyme required for sulfatase activity